jgi:hypothetical protein
MFFLLFFISEAHAVNSAILEAVSAACGDRVYPKAGEEISASLTDEVSTCYLTAMQDIYSKKQNPTQIAFDICKEFSAYPIKGREEYGCLKKFNLKSMDEDFAEKFSFCQHKSKSHDSAEKNHEAYLCLKEESDQVLNALNHKEARDKKDKMKPSEAFVHMAAQGCGQNNETDLFQKETIVPSDVKDMALCYQNALKILNGQHGKIGNFALAICKTLPQTDQKIACVRRTLAGYESAEFPEVKIKKKLPNGVKQSLEKRIKKHQPIVQDYYECAGTDRNTTPEKNAEIYKCLEEKMSKSDAAIDVAPAPAAAEGTASSSSGSQN